MHNLGDIKGESTEGTNQISLKLPTSRRREQNSLNTVLDPMHFGVAGNAVRNYALLKGTLKYYF